jgi:hypothetical protein
MPIDDVIAALEGALPANEPAREGVPVVLPTEVVVNALVALDLLRLTR